MRAAIGSQCKLMNRGVTCVLFGSLKINLAAELIMFKHSSHTIQYSNFLYRDFGDAMDTVETFVCRQQVIRNYKWRVQKGISWYIYVLYIFSSRITLSLEQPLIRPVDEYWLTRDSSVFCPVA